MEAKHRLLSAVFVASVVLANSASAAPVQANLPASPQAALPQAASASQGNTVGNFIPPYTLLLPSPPSGFQVSFTPERLTATKEGALWIARTRIDVSKQRSSSEPDLDHCKFWYNQIQMDIGTPPHKSIEAITVPDTPHKNNNNIGSCFFNTNKTITIYNDLTSICSKNPGTLQILQSKVLTKALAQRSNTAPVIDDRIFNITATCACSTFVVDNIPNTSPLLFIGTEQAQSFSRVSAQRNLLHVRATHKPVQLSHSGNLPPGTSVTTDGTTIKLIGNATAEGNYVFTVRAADSCQLGAQYQDKTLTVPVRLGQIAFTESQIPVAYTGVPFSYQLKTNAEGSRYTRLNFKAFQLPPGLSMSATGLISGTPKVSGTYNTVLFEAEHVPTDNYRLTTAAIRPVMQVITPLQPAKP